MTFQSGKRKTVTRSLRINEEWDRVLQKEAHREGVSVNALANRILRRYSLYHRFADRYDTITMSQACISAILEGVPETYLEKVGVISGATTPKDAFLTMGRPLDLNSLTWVMDELLGGPYFLKWFKCDHHTKENMDIFHIRHSLGKKWSIFLGSYLKSMFKSILDLDIDPEIIDGALHIVIKHVH